MPTADIARTFLRPTYQDLLRTLGGLADQRGWRDLVITEKPGGFVVSGYRDGEHGEAISIIRLTRTELSRLVAEARGRRGIGRPPRRPAGSRLAALQAQPGGPGTAPFTAWVESGRYEARLRAIGWLSDTTGLHQLQVLEEGEDLIVHGQRASVPGMQVAPSRLTPRDMQHLLHKLAGLRRVEQTSPAAS